MRYKIDAATIEDTETIVNFQLAMAAETEGIQLDYDTVREGVKAAIADDAKAIYLLAKNEQNDVLGMLMLTTEWSDWHNCRYYWLQSVYVREDSRRQGVFAELFQFAQMVAQSDDSAALRLYVHCDNAAAQAVYKAMGMHESHYKLYEL